MLSKSGIVSIAPAALTLLALAYGSLALAKTQEPSPEAPQPTQADQSCRQRPRADGGIQSPKSSPAGLDVSTINRPSGTSNGFCADSTSPASVKYLANWAAPFWAWNSKRGMIDLIGPDGEPVSGPDGRPVIGILIDMTSTSVALPSVACVLERIQPTRRFISTC